MTKAAAAPPAPAAAAPTPTGVRARLGPRTGTAPGTTAAAPGTTAAAAAAKKPAPDLRGAIDLRRSLRAAAAAAAAATAGAVPGAQAPQAAAAVSALGAALGAAGAPALGSRLAGRLRRPEQQPRAPAPNNIVVTIGAEPPARAASAFALELAKDPAPAPAAPGPLVSRLSRHAQEAKAARAVPPNAVQAPAAPAAAPIAQPAAIAAAAAALQAKNPAIQIANLLPNTSAADLKMAFSGFGTIREVEMQYSTDTDSATATIVYDSEQACAAAIAQFDNTVADGRVLRITMVPRMRSLAGLAAQPAGRSLAAEQNHMQVDQPMHTAGPPQQESLASRIAAAASYADRIEADQLARKARISKLGLRGPQALLANAVAAARASMSGPTTTFVNTQ